MSKLSAYLITGIFLWNLSLILSPSVFAAVNISIDSYPSSVTIGQEFTVSITANDLSSGTSYYLKGRIGSGTDLDKAETNNPNNSTPDDWLFDTDSWSKFPQIAIGDTSTWSGTLKLRAKKNASVGTNIFRIRLKKTSSDTTYNSIDYSLNLEAAPTPTPTPTPTPSPTTTPTAVVTLSPTVTAAPSATNKPQATPTKYISPTVKPTLFPTLRIDKSEGSVLGEVSSPSVTQEPTQAQFITDKKQGQMPIFALLFGGGLLFITAAVILSFKQIKPRS